MARHPDADRIASEVAQIAETRDTPAQRALALLESLGPTLGFAIDPLRSASAATQLVHNAIAAVMITKTHGVLPLPGRPGHSELRPESPALAAIQNMLDSPQTSFVLPVSPAPEDYLTVTALGAPDNAPDDMVAIVVLSPCGDLHGLTRRELEVLGLLIDGYHNGDAARRLTVTQRTIATHIEHILTKLDANTRTLAAVRAQRRGLFIPPALVGGVGE